MNPNVLLLALAPLAPPQAPQARGDAQDLDLARYTGLHLEDVLGSGFDLHAGGLLRTYFHHTDSDLLGNDDTELDLEDGDVNLELRRGDLRLRVSADFSDGSNRVEDGHARWSVTPALDLTVGRFRPRYLFSSSMDPEHLAFRERTALGAFYDEFDQGVELSWRYDQFRLTASAVDGGDDEFRNSRYVGRAEWALYDGFWEASEAVLDAPNHLRMLLGAVIVHDDAGPRDDRELGIDTALTFGPWGFQAEWMDFDEGSAGRIDDVVDDALALKANSRPYALTLSRCIDRRFVVAGRYQDLDDAADTRVIGLAGRYFPFADRTASVMVDVSGYDREGPDGIVAQIGLILGQTRF